MKLLLIDNYDSFIYNLRYELNSLNVAVTVCRNNVNYDELSKLIKQHDGIVISPGPSTPDNAGHCLRVVKDFYQQKPILGICLGHQTIAQALGAKVVKAKTIVHGKNSKIKLIDGDLFLDLDSSLKVARYHSLIVDKLPEELKISAVSETNEVMAFQHQHYPVYGLQFHPESIMNFEGKKILENFIHKTLLQSNIKETNHAECA